MDFGLGAAVLGSVAGQIGGGLLQDYWGRKAADKQMDFQERMSNTSYQRAVADMRKAGLNPMLAFAQGGASSPSGSSYAPPHITEGLSSTALGAKRLKQDVIESMSRIDQQEAQTEAALAMAERERSQAKLNDAQYFPLSKMNEFYQNNPWFIPLMKGMEAIGSGAGTARDISLMYRGIKGFGSVEGETDKAGPNFRSRTKWKRR